MAIFFRGGGVDWLYIL